MKLLIAIATLLVAYEVSACKDSPANQDLNAAHASFQKVASLIREHHPDASLAKLEMKMKSSREGASHYLAVLKNQETEQCHAYYISAVKKDNCQHTAILGPKLNIGDRCQLL